LLAEINEDAVSMVAAAKILRLNIVRLL